jgi:hypothetical protein
MSANLLRPDTISPDENPHGTSVGGRLIVIRTSNNGGVAISRYRDGRALGTRCGGCSTYQLGTLLKSQHLRAGGGGQHQEENHYSFCHEITKV